MCHGVTIIMKRRASLLAKNIALVWKH